MDLKINKYIVYSVILVLVLLVAFNFEKLTGYASKSSPAVITITNTLPGGDVLKDRMTVRLLVENSYPNQLLRVYSEEGRFEGYSVKTENCKFAGSNRGYTCEADLYVTSNELEDGERYYIQAVGRKGNLEEGKAFFTFKK